MNVAPDNLTETTGETEPQHPANLLAFLTCTNCKITDGCPFKPLILE